MEAPTTEYALHDGVHVGFQVWGSGSPDAVDVLEFSSGLMISIDETLDEPNWLRYTERIGDFCRLIRFDAGGLGLSDPLPTGTGFSIERWGRDALAVMDAAGCRRAVVLASTGGAMAAIWLAATHPERVTSLILVNGTARVGRADDYGFGVPEDLTAAAADIDVPLTEGDVPQDIAVFAPAWRTVSASGNGGGGRPGAAPVRPRQPPSTSSPSRPTCGTTCPRSRAPTLVISRSEGFANLVQHGRYLGERIVGARFVTFPGHDLLPWAGEFDSIVDEVEEFVTGGRGRARGQRGCWPPCCSPTSSSRRCKRPKWATGSGAPCSTSST